jgi:predicted Zn-dependent protease with MMP-like domain
MNRRKFEQFVDEAMQQLPAALSDRIDNLAVRIENRPTPAQLRRWDVPLGTMLLGFYEGVPLSERTADYGLVPPDIIYVFQRSIEEVCSTEEEIREEVGRTVRHEIAHHFGIDDERLEELDRY